MKFLGALFVTVVGLACDDPSKTKTYVIGEGVQPATGEGDAQEPSSEKMASSIDAEQIVRTPSSDRGKTGTTPTAPAATPAGKLVTKVGVNFEDSTVNSDADFNDVILCLTGQFRVEANRFVSTANQNISLTTSKGGACKHNVRIVLVDTADKEGSATLPSDYAQAFVVNNFHIGDSVRFEMVATEGCDPGIIRSMSDAAVAKITPDACLAPVPAAK